MSKKNIILNILITISTIIVIYIIKPFLINIKDWFMWSLTISDGEIDKGVMWTAIGSLATVLAVVSGLYVLYRTLNAQIKESKFQMEMQEHNSIVSDFKDVLKQIEPGMIFKALKYLDIDTNQCYCDMMDYINSALRLGYRIALTIPTNEYNEIILSNKNWTKSLKELIDFQENEIEKIRNKLNELNNNKFYNEQKLKLMEVNNLNNEIINLATSEIKDDLLSKNEANIKMLQESIDDLKKYSDINLIKKDIENIKEELGKISSEKYNLFYQDSKQYLENRKRTILKKYNKL